MASISFPASPSDGDRVNGYIYDAVTQTWSRPPLNSLSLVADVDTSQGLAEGANLFFDSTSEKWIAEKQAVPTGTVFAFAGSTEPDGYLLCDGRLLLISEYQDLYDTIGTAYNGEEPPTSFRLPNLSGRVPVKHLSTDADFTPVGKRSGQKSVTLTSSQMPSHTHTQKSHNHIQDSHNHGQDAHSHGYTIPFYPSGWEAGGYGTGYYGSFRGRAMVTNSYTGLGTDGRTPYIQNTTATNQNTTATNQYTGGGQAHSNLQPYIVVNYIIKS